MDAKYVEELLLDEPETPEPEPEPAVVAETPVPPTPEPVAQADEPDEFDHDFDLSLDDLEEASPAQVTNPTDHYDLELDAPVLPAINDDDELSFESVLKQQSEAKAASAPDDLADFDLADFDLDSAEDEPALSAEDDFLLSLDEPPLNLGESAPAQPADDLDLPDDFDLSLADEIETDQATQAFASEIEDVNAELERLSQKLEQPPMATPFEAPSFTAGDAAALDDDEPEFDFLSGTDEAATKLDLARAYIEMGDSDGARDILDEVVTEGDDGQKTEARDMLSRLV